MNCRRTEIPGPLLDRPAKIVLCAGLLLQGSLLSYVTHNRNRAMQDPVGFVKSPEFLEGDSLSQKVFNKLKHSQKMALISEGFKISEPASDTYNWTDSYKLLERGFIKLSDIPVAFSFRFGGHKARKSFLLSGNTDYPITVMSQNTSQLSSIIEAD